MIEKYHQIQVGDFLIFGRGPQHDTWFIFEIIDDVDDIIHFRYLYSVNGTNYIARGKGPFYFLKSSFELIR